MQSPRRPYLVLRHRDFRLLWASMLVSTLGSQMQVAAMEWHIYVLTRSPLALGLMGLVRVLPIIVFSLFGGVVADRRNRRVVMFIAQSVMTAAAILLFAATRAGSDAPLLLYGIAALSASATAFDNPARQALVARLVPAGELPAALTLNLTQFHIAMIGGPALAGVLIAGSGAVLGPALPPAGSPAPDRAGLALIYILNAVSFLGVLATLIAMRTPGGVEASSRTERPLESLRTGLRFVFTTPVMVWTMGLDFFATFFAGAMSLLPIFADQVLGVGPVGYGWMRAAPAAGALLAGMALTIRQLPAAQGRAILAAVAIYGASTTIFGLSRAFWLTLTALALGGVADLVSTVIRQTLRQTLTPDALRGRMTSVNMIFFMGGPQLGELEAGFVASLFASAATGATISVVSGGVATILTAIFVALRTPVVRRYRSPPAA